MGLCTIKYEERREMRQQGGLQEYGGEFELRESTVCNSQVKATNELPQYRGSLALSLPFVVTDMVGKEE